MSDWLKGLIILAALFCFTFLTAYGMYLFWG